MKFFSLPADFKTSTIDRYRELNDRYEDSTILETYGQVTEGGVLSSGRITDVLPAVDFRLLESYARYSAERQIDFNYTLNPSCLGNFEFSEHGLSQIYTLLERLYGMGVKSLTLSSPSLFELVKASGFEFEMKASALCEITSPGKALFYRKLGANRIVVDPDITRNFRVLDNISNVFDDGVEIIVNNVCYKNCAYKMFHYNHESHCTSLNTSQDIKDYFFNRCSMQKAGSIENVIRLNWIRPEDLNYYCQVGIRYFKIQGRQNVLEGDVVKALTQYINEDYDGNLFDLITIFAPYNAFQPYINNKSLHGYVKKFFDHPDFCQNVCDSCNYCYSYAKKSMDPVKADQINREATAFYQKYDTFTRLVQEKKSQKVKRLFNKKEFKEDFDL